MLARALAKESGATFINIAVSALANKWYGESNKLIAGLFGLARKTQPSIIFIDEIDSFLKERSRGDHEVTAMMKAEFMTYVSIVFRFLLYQDKLLFYHFVFWFRRLSDESADPLLLSTIASGMDFCPGQIAFWSWALRIALWILIQLFSAECQSDFLLDFLKRSNASKFFPL